MSNKQLLVKELFEVSLNLMINSSSEWIEFLKTASFNYKYDFSNQVLIYAQRPLAKGCATVDEWNKKQRRWIKRGSKGIALLENENGIDKLKYVFELADTYSGINKPYYLWYLGDNVLQRVIDDINKEYDYNSQMIESSILLLTNSNVQDNIEDYFNEIINNKENSKLENVDNDTIKKHLHELLCNSINYMVLNRCGLNPNKLYFENDFNSIKNFNTIAVISRLGNAISQIAFQELNLIHESIVKFSKEKNLKIDYKNKEEYNENNKSERSFENENTIQKSERSSSTRFETRKNESETIREIRFASIGIPKEQQERTLSRTNDEMQSARTSSRNSNDSRENVRANSITISQGEQSDRRNEEQRTVNVGGLNEQFQIPSRGTNNEGLNIQLERGKCYKLSNGNLFEFHTNEEGYYYAIYDTNGVEIDGGLLEYGENESNQSIIDIRKRLAEFSGINEIADESLEEVTIDYLEDLENRNTKINGSEINFLDKPIKNIGKEIKNDLNPNMSQEKQKSINYTIKDFELGNGTPKERYKNNIEAIKLIKKLDEENRYATSEEQEILAKYVGWGGLPDCFDESKNEWHKEYLELKTLLSEEEYKNARESSLTAFYTPPVVIKAIYDVLVKNGVETANILEPSCGIGNFFGLLPNTMKESKMYGVELDSISGRIAKQLYQNVNIQIKRI